MGRRKSRAKPPQPKKREGVPKTFDCPFCNHEKAVECQIDKTRKMGVLRCTVCTADYKSTIDVLTEPVDIYSEWIDECERVKNET